MMILLWIISASSSWATVGFHYTFCVVYHLPVESISNIQHKYNKKYVYLHVAMTFIFISIVKSHSLVSVPSAIYTLSKHSKISNLYSYYWTRLMSKKCIFWACKGYYLWFLTMHDGTWKFFLWRIWISNLHLNSS